MLNLDRVVGCMAVGSDIDGSWRQDRWCGDGSVAQFLAGKAPRNSET